MKWLISLKRKKNQSLCSSLWKAYGWISLKQSLVFWCWCVSKNPLFWNFTAFHYDCHCCWFFNYLAHLEPNICSERTRAMQWHTCTPESLSFLQLGLNCFKGHEQQFRHHLLPLWQFPQKTVKMEKRNSWYLKVNELLSTQSSSCPRQMRIQQWNFNSRITVWFNAWEKGSYKGISSMMPYHWNILGKLQNYSGPPCHPTLR